MDGLLTQIRLWQILDGQLFPKNNTTSAFQLSLNESEILHAIKLQLVSNISHSVESRDLSDRVHGISCQYSVKTSKQTYHTVVYTIRLS